MLLRSAAAGLVPVVTTERSRIERGIMGFYLVRPVWPTMTPSTLIRRAVGMRRGSQLARRPLGQNSIYPQIFHIAHSRNRIIPSARIRDNFGKYPSNTSL